MKYILIYFNLIGYNLYTMSIKPKITFLPVDNGDSIVITIDDYTILIDGGLANKYKILKQHLTSNKIQTINLLILTHSDRDHIGGIISLIKDFDFAIETIWFNSYDKLSQLFDKETKDTSKDISIGSLSREISFAKAKTLSGLLDEQNKHYESIFNEKFENYKYDIGDIKFTFLSPSKKVLSDLYKQWSIEDNRICKKEISSTVKGIKTIEDYAKNIEKCKPDSSIQNASSIAFILSYKDSNFLLLGDAHIDVIVASLKALNYNQNNKLYVDFIKLSHHGSNANISQEFLDIVETKKYIISTNGKSHNHPDMETLSLLVVDAKTKNKKIELSFNYPPHVYKNEKGILKDNVHQDLYGYALNFADDSSKGYTIEV